MNSKPLAATMISVKAAAETNEPGNLSLRIGKESSDDGSWRLLHQVSMVGVRHCHDLLPLLAANRSFRRQPFRILSRLELLLGD